MATPFDVAEYILSAAIRNYLSAYSNVNGMKNSFIHFEGISFQIFSVYKQMENILK